MDDDQLSFAQNFEDVRLWRALKDWPHRFYVDVGAAHPRELSVTHFFYRRGWRGINIEPGPRYGALVAQRERDINCRVAIGMKSGSGLFHVHHQHPDLSTAQTPPSEESIARSYSPQTVRFTTLAELLEEHAPNQPIAFLKVDVEGSEHDVLKSNDWSRFAPTIVLVESIAPDNRKAAFEAWEPLLLAEGYEWAYDDGINRFYVHHSASQLKDSLQQPVTALDGYMPHMWLTFNADEWRKHREEREMLMQRVLTFDRHLKEKACDDLERQKRARMESISLALVEGKLQVTEAHRRNIVNSRLWQGAQYVLNMLPGLQSSLARGKKKRMTRLTQSEILRLHYREATANGKPLASVLHIKTDRPPLSEEAHVMDRIRQVRMEQGASLLSAEEKCALLNAPAHPDLFHETIQQHLVELEQALSPTEGHSSPYLFLIDAGALQIENRCGIKTHGINVVLACSRILRKLEIPFAFLTHDDMPPLDEQYAELATDVWAPRDPTSVRVFLRLAPFFQHDNAYVRTLVRAPWVKKWAIWLDGIMSLYPDAFLPDPRTFWYYQLGLEQLLRAEKLFAISEMSAQEARAFLGEHAAIHITRCLPGTSRAIDAAYNPIPFKRYALVTGNPLPHKNLALALTAFAAYFARHDDLDGLVIAAHVPPAQREAFIKLADACGLPPTRMVCIGGLAEGAYERVIRDATMVIVPSLHEGFSLSIVEALQLGTPILCSDIPAHRELLDDPATLFDPTDPVSLLEAMESFQSAPRGLLERQRVRLAQLYSPNQFVDTFQQELATLQHDPGVMQIDGFAPRRRETPGADPSRPLSLCKVCEIEDFLHPRLYPVLMDVFSYERKRLGSAYPEGFETRKQWEVAMAVLAFKESGLLDGARDFLGIGAGNEATLFYLTRYAHRVLATDLYLAEGWEESAPSNMIENPEWHWPFYWRPDRLKAKHMDALRLDLADASFDAIFSSSSIEHFGTHAEVQAALAEMHRVLKPGGVLSLSTEFRIRGPSPGIKHVLMFDEDEIKALFLDNAMWEPLEPFSADVSEYTLSHPVSHAEACHVQEQYIKKLGALLPHHIRYSEYPHIVMDIPSHRFTSFHLALRKR